MELYRRRIDGRSKTGDEANAARKIEEVERELRLAALSAERDEYYRLSRTRKISEDVARKFVREVDLQEARLNID